MKRFIMALALGAGLLACSETQTATTAAGLSGTYDLTIVDMLVFVTSSDRDELRVLDLNLNEDGVRDYVRAPNPLEPLSISVLPRPIALARDVQYNREGRVGQEVAGPYVYARSAGSREISVVGAGPKEDLNQLREVRRLIVTGLVTALAARGPVRDGGDSFLYYSTQSASGAQVWEQKLPGPATLKDAVLDPPRSVASLVPGETVQALLVLPEENSLVIATRWGVGSGGRTVRVNTQAPDQFVELRFGGPVRLLATHPALPAELEDVTALGTFNARQRAGALIFGVLDEGACRLPSGCSGVLAVESATGQLAKDLLPVRDQPGTLVTYREGAEMLPIASGSALPTGLTLATGAQTVVRISANSDARVTYPLVGIVPMSNGDIILFNALELRHFDFDRVAATSRVELRNAAEQAKDTGRTGVLTVGTVNGATQSDNYRVIFQGPLPGLTNLAPRAGPLFEVPREAAERSGVRAGDLLVLQDPTATACPPSQEVSVTQVQLGATTATLLTGPLAEGCADYRRFSLLAGGNQPFTLVSEVQGYLGRMAAGETFTVPGPYFIRPDPSEKPEKAGEPGVPDPAAEPEDFDPSLTPVQARLTLTSQEVLARGDRYVALVNGHFQPYIARVNTGDVGARLANYRLPASVVYAKIGQEENAPRNAYIAYPSADGVLQVDLKRFEFAQPNSLPLVPFE